MRSPARGMDNVMRALKASKLLRRFLHRGAAMRYNLHGLRKKLAPHTIRTLPIFCLLRGLRRRHPYSPTLAGRRGAIQEAGQAREQQQ